MLIKPCTVIVGFQHLCSTVERRRMVVICLLGLDLIESDTYAEVTGRAPAGAVDLARI